MSLAFRGVFGVLLWGRWRFGWRGRTAIHWTLSGFAFLALAYFGSKLVLELPRMETARSCCPTGWEPGAGRRHGQAERSKSGLGPARVAKPITAIPPAKPSMPSMKL